MIDTAVHVDPTAWLKAYTICTPAVHVVGRAC